MRDPFVTNALWHRYLLERDLASNDSRKGILCSVHSLGNASHSDSRQARSSFDHWLRLGFVSWMFPLLWLVGLVGIVFTLATLRRYPRIVPSTTRVWLLALLVTDLLLLSAVGLRWWAYTVFATRVTGWQAALSCACNYANYALVQLSGWLQACVFLERMLVVHRPLLAKVYLRPARVRCAVALLVATAAVLNLPVPVLTCHFVGVTSLADGTVQLACSHWAILGLRAVAFADLCIGSLLPLIVMLAGTVVITRALLQHQVSRPLHKSASAASAASSSAAAAAAAAAAGNSRTHAPVSSRERQRRICVVSLCMNLLYMLTNCPLSLLLLYTLLSPGSVNRPAALSAYTMLYLLSMVNNATNWAVLTITGRSYRLKLIESFTCCRVKPKRIRRSASSADSMIS